LVSASHISPNSPCVGAGSANYSTGIDIDGEAWKNPPSVGCDEVYINNLTGDLKVDIFAEYTSTVTETELEFKSIIKGKAMSNYWSFSDGKSDSDKCIVKHSYPTAGKYKVILSAFNLDNPAGVSATVMVNIVELKNATYYVNKANTTPVSPYKSWNTAATNIQDAVDAVKPQIKGALVLVKNGIYYPADQISVTKAIIIKSVKGAEKTIINGSHSHRCFYLNYNAIIDGFTITNGYIHDKGGGVFGGIVSNCTITGNSVHDGGGGAAACTINNCTISGNSARFNGDGGGTYGGTINNCIISGNSALDGGGTYLGTVNNCTIIENIAVSFNGIDGRGGGTFLGTVNNCTISGNSAGFNGGGTYHGTVNNCIISGNSADEGGGTCCGTINNCTISGNSATNVGGGTYRGTANNCTISGNSAAKGGGTYWSDINNCTISGNSAEYEGGGTYYGAINNCIICGNTAMNGGGAYCGNGYMYNSVNNCTICGNSASDCGGGIYGNPLDYSVINNCIIWDNSANVSNNFYDCTINYSCTTPLPSGEGNISRNPQFISSSDFHLKITSPCINAGTNAFAPMPYDLDSYPRIVNGIVDMGCYEANPTHTSPVFDDAETLPSDYDLADGSNTNAITEPGEPAHAGYGPFHSVWWDWKSPGNSLVLSGAKDADGDMLLVDTHGSDFDTVLAVYTGLDVSNLTEIASNDDAGPGTNTSEVVFDFIANETYHIVVAGKTESDTGNIVLHYEIIPEPLLFINCYLLFIIYYLRKLNFIKN